MALATKVSPDQALWRFRWERLIQRSVSSALAENGGDTFGGCVVVGGDAEVAAAVDAFVARLVGDKGARLSANDVRSALERRRGARARGGRPRRWPGAWNRSAPPSGCGGGRRRGRRREARRGRDQALLRESAKE